MATSWVPVDDDAALEEQAQRRAEETLSSLDKATRALKLPTVKAGILKSLRNQRGTSAPGPAPPTAKAHSNAGAAGQRLPEVPVPFTATTSSGTSSGNGGLQNRSLQRPPRTQAYGDESWFADSDLRQRLLRSAAAAHAAHKIVVAAPAEEIWRILPSQAGRPPLAAGAVLRLGGALHGGYGEADIKSVYRQLSRALHPDKNLGVPEAPEAFKRLSDCAEELRKTVADTQKTLQRMCLAVGAVVTQAMLERPQSPLLAEASRLMSAVLALSGEGLVPPAARTRAVAAFGCNPAFAGCVGKRLLPEWFESEDLLEHFASTALRTAYDCSPKRFRAQFLCLLNRLAANEAARNDSCVRGTWQTVLSQYPEVALWRDILDKLRRRVSLPEHTGPDDQCKAPSTGQEAADASQEDQQTSSWANWWRTLLSCIVPCGDDASLPLGDKEVGLLALNIWEDFAEWATKDGMEQHFNLFAAEANQGDAAEVKWAYLPAADLLLSVGEGLVGLSAEGVCLQRKASGGPASLLTFAAALRRQRKGSEKRGLSCPAEEQKAKQAKLSKDPTRVVLLTNLVGAGEVDEDLESETAEEAKKYGKLLKCTVREVPNSPNHEAVRIFLEFDKVESASRAYADMNGRYFGGRAVKARFFDEERYKRGDLTRRSNSSVLLLTNLVAPEDVDDELEAETLAEARAKFGKVKACKLISVPGAKSQEAVRIFLEFEQATDAAKAQQTLNGRTFGTQEVSAHFYDEEKYRAGDLLWTDLGQKRKSDHPAVREESSKKPKKKSTFI